MNKKIVDYNKIVQVHQTTEVERGKHLKELGKMTKSLELSKSIKSNKVLSFKLLSQVASSVPRGVKFTSLDYDGKKRLIIEGSSSNDKNILQLIRNLNEKKLISQATLANMASSGRSSDGKNLKGFKIICTVK